MITMVEDSRQRTYAKGQTILYPEERSPDIYVIAEGVVTMHDIDDDGHRRILHILGPPALFPMVGFSSEFVTSSWFYAALTDTRVYVLPYQEFKSRLEKIDGANAYNALLKQLLAEVHELLIQLAQSTRSSGETRLLVALKFLAVHHTRARSGNWRLVNFLVPHHLLADMTGLTRETVSVLMKQLHQKKLVRYPAAGKLEINSSRLFKI